MVVAAIKEGLKDVAENPDYHAKKGTLYAVGKGLVEVLCGAGGLFSGFGMIGLYAATAGLSAILVQMDFNRQIQDLIERYRPEIAIKRHKSPNEVTKDDFFIVAKINPILAEEVRKVKRNRTYGIVVSIIASITSATIMTAITAATGGLFATILGYHFLAIAAKGAVGYGIYYAAQKPLNWVGNKLFGLEKETAHERIEALAKDHELGRAVSCEQVLGVFVAAHPHLDNYITEKYGARFDALDGANKQRATEEMKGMFQLERLADGFNNDTFNVGALAFAAGGESISDLALTQEREAKRRGPLKKVFDTVSKPFKSTYQNNPGMQITPLPVQSTQPTYYDNPNARTGHVQRTGLTPRDPALGQVAKLKQPVQNAPSSPTIQ